MILQCDQCNTKFKLDDGKIKAGGVKVRCSKCKHVFVVTRNDQDEVADFDALLNTLGTEGPGPEAAAPPALGDEAAEDQDGPNSGPLVDGEIESRILAEAAKYKDEAPADGDEGFDLSDFNFTEEPITETTPPPADEGVVPEANGFDSSEFDFNAEAEPESSPAFEVKAGPTVEETGSYNDFNFTEEPLSVAEAAVKSPEGTDFGDVTFTEESLEAPAPVVNVADTGTDFDFNSFALDSADDASQKDAKAEPPQVPSPVIPESNDFSFDFGEQESVEGASSHSSTTDKPRNPDVPVFSFGDAPLHQSAQKPNTSAQGEGKYSFNANDFGQMPSPAIAGKDPEPFSPFDGLDFMDGQQGKDDYFSATAFSDEDELPPLSIGSRRKGSSLATVSGITVAVVGLLVLTGAGLFLLKKDPSTFNKIGLGTVATWFDKKNVEEGRIVITNPSGEFIVNDVAGELFVISGEAVNQFTKPRASIQVKATVFGKNGVVAMQKAAYCGNRLSKEQLVSLPPEKLEAAMNNQFGDSLSNLGVQPGKGIPFVVVFTTVPQDVVEFGVEVAGSTVASP